MKDKTDCILEVIEDPSMCEDAWLRDVLADPETAEIYRTINKIADALTETTEPDLNQEWMAFVNKNRDALSLKSTRIFRKIFRRKVVAAVFIALASLSLMAAGIVISFSVSKNNSTEGIGMEERIDHISENASELEEDTLMSETPAGNETLVIIYKDEPLEKIIKDMSLHYGFSVIYKSDAQKDLHLYFQWNRSQSLSETVAQLNHFQQINIKMNGNSLIVE